MMQGDFEYFIEHKDEIVTGHEDAFIYIKDGELVGYYKDPDELFELIKKYLTDEKNVLVLHWFNKDGDDETHV
jgi:hypothetical protein